MSSFNITTPETSLRLRPSSVAKGKTASGSVTYSVTNTSGSTKRVRLRIDPDENAAQEWFTVRGGEERDIQPGATESFSVDVAAPGSAAPQDYSFTAVAVNLDDSDNDFERGAAIAFAAPAIEAGGGPKVKWWMIAIPIAAVVLIGGGVLTYFLIPRGDPFPVAGVVDDPLDDAITTIEGQGLKVKKKFVGETEEPESEEGLVKMVKDQEPQAGEEIKPKKTVTLSWDWVSNMVSYTDVRGQTLEQAGSLLSESGLQVEERMLSESPPSAERMPFWEKIVSEQTPSPDELTEIPATTAVQLAWEWRPKELVVPGNLGAMHPGDAAKKVLDAGFDVTLSGPFGAQPTSRHIPRVVSSNPLEGEAAMAGSAVVLNVDWRENRRCQANPQICVAILDQYKALRVEEVSPHLRLNTDLVIDNN